LLYLEPIHREMLRSQTVDTSTPVVYNYAMTGPRFTRGGMAAEMVRRGGHPEASERLVSYYVQLGLLDESTPGRSRGRGRGVPRYWPQSQCDLLCVLLDYRKQGAKIPALCNIPVFLWTYFGDGRVPLRQARRTLQTWVDATDRAAWGQSMRSANRLIAQVAPKLRGEPRAVLAARIANVAYAGRFDEGELDAALREVAGPENELVIDGEIRYASDNPIGQLAAQLYARRHLKEISDDLFRLARQDLQNTLPAGCDLRPGRTRITEPGGEHAAMLQGMIFHACWRLTWMLGFHLRAADRAFREGCGAA
jgi:hypothetical protein